MRRREFLRAAAGAAALPALYVPAAASASSAAAPFPREFLWGAAASAYQIEGAAGADGKGESAWDVFAARRGAIADGQTGAEACDFYHRYPGDIARMRALGLKAFRFSIAWTRVLPTGRGAVNQRGLDFYRRLTDALLEAGITPVATLFHWDTPEALARAGGWQSRAMADWFSEYAAVAARALGDRIPWWLTINEPRSFIGGGYVAGVQAPGLRLARREALAAAHVVLLAHGRAVAALRAHLPGSARIGLPNDITPALPQTAAEAALAEAATFASAPAHFSVAGWWNENAWWLDPVYRGAYPTDALAILGADAPAVAAGDMRTIAQPLDFLAANIYGGRPVQPGPGGRARTAPWPRGMAHTANGWQVTPEALYWAPRWLHQRYRLPVFVTENGCAGCDWVALDGGVHDPQRVDFTARYLHALAQAVTEGTPVLGYLHWSLLDNFEWQQGYTQRFGLIHVDFQSQQRVLKDSARWYARVIAAGGAT